MNTFSDTTAKLVSYDSDNGEGITQPSKLRQKTALLLSDSDRKYAGKRTSRRDLDENSDGNPRKLSLIKLQSISQHFFLILWVTSTCTSTLYKLEGCSIILCRYDYEMKCTRQKCLYSFWLKCQLSVT